MEEALRTYVEAEAVAATPAEASEALRHQADVLRVRCEWEEAGVRADAAERVARAAGLADLAAEAVNARAAIAQSRSELDQAAELYREVLDTTGNPRIRGCALQNLGAIAAMGADHDRAAEYF